MQQFTMHMVLEGTISLTHASNRQQLLLGLQWMLKMMILHCNKSFGLTMHGLMDAMKNARSTVDQGTAILSTLHSSSAVSTAEAYTRSFRHPTNKINLGSSGLMKDVAKIFGPSLHPLWAAQNNFGGRTTTGWGTACISHISSNIQWDDVQQLW
jgi:hypothetical protein